MRLSHFNILPQQSNFYDISPFLEPLRDKGAGKTLFHKKVVARFLPFLLPLLFPFPFAASRCRFAAKSYFVL